MRHGHARVQPFAISDIGPEKLGTRGENVISHLADFVLVEPQLGDNIGQVARAMLNFGHADLTLVNPRDGWPNPKAYQFGSGADEVLDGARVCWTVDEALSQHTLVFAATARARYMEKKAVDPAEMARLAREEVARGGKVAVMFGRERTGLENEDVARADCIVSIPVNPAFPSLNLAQSVGIIAYELRPDATQLTAAVSLSETAPRAEFDGMIGHLFSELREGGYFFPEDKTPVMEDNIRTALLRGRFTSPEILTLRGIIKALAIGRGARWRKRISDETNRP